MPLTTSGQKPPPLLPVTPQHLILPIRSLLPFPSTSPPALSLPCLLGNRMGRISNKDDRPCHLLTKSTLMPPHGLQVKFSFLNLVYEVLQDPDPSHFTSAARGFSHFQTYQVSGPLPLLFPLPGAAFPRYHVSDSLSSYGLFLKCHLFQEVFPEHLI